MGLSEASGLYAPDQNENALVALRMRQARDSLEPMVLITAVNQTHQDSLVAAFDPSPEKPMHVRRLDTGVILTTTDGTKWDEVNGTPTVRFVKESDQTGIAANPANNTLVGFTVNTANSVASPGDLVTVNTTTESSILAGGVFTPKVTGRYAIDLDVLVPIASQPFGQYLVRLLPVAGGGITGKWLRIGGGNPGEPPEFVSHRWSSLKLTAGAKYRISLDRFGGASTVHGLFSDQAQTSITFALLGRL